MSQLGVYARILGPIVYGGVLIVFILQLQFLERICLWVCVVLLEISTRKVLATISQKRRSLPFPCKHWMKREYHSGNIEIRYSTMVTP
jgi:hypothetical protein